MQTALRKIGSSTGMIVPKALLIEMGLAVGAKLDLYVEDGRLVARPKGKVREGWAEDAAKVAAAEEDPDEAAWVAFGNDGDDDLTLVMQGDVWLVRLDPTVGSEIQKTRPCLIVSPDELNGVLRRVIAAPMTSGSHPASFRITTVFRRKTGLVLLDQIRTVDRNRLVSRLGALDDRTVRQALTVLQALFQPTDLASNTPAPSA